MQLAEHFDLPAATDEALSEARAARADYEQAGERLRSATDRALEVLAKEYPELGLRDVAELVGVSYQRVGQLRPGGPRRGRKAAPTIG